MILDAGLGCWSLVFRTLLDEFAEITDVLALDRYGYGHSSYVNDGSNRIVDHVENLETILKLLEVDQPILFLAHSLAGVCATYFARKRNPCSVTDKGTFCGSRLFKKSSKLPLTFPPTLRASHSEEQAENGWSNLH